MRRTLVALVLLLGACSPGTASDTSIAPTTTAAPTDADELSAAAMELLDAGSFSFEVELAGPPIPVEAVGGLGVSDLAGVAVLPDRASGDVTGAVGPIGLSTPFVYDGPTLWVANPFGDSWLELVAAEVVDIPAVLDGLPEVLSSDVDQVVAEQVDGVTVFRGNLDTTRLSELADGGLGAGVTSMRATTGPDGALAILVFDDPVEIGRTWTFRFADLGIEAEIVPPVG